MDIQIIDTGYFYADGGAMFGAIPKTAWSRRYPSNETNGCVLAMRSLLVSNVPEKVILIDIDLRLFDGHTPSQIVPYIQTGGQTFVFAGDVIPLAASVSPEWISAYDTFPVTSYQEKVRLLEEAAREGQVLIYCHDAYTRCSTVKKVNDFFKKDKTIEI